MDISRLASVYQADGPFATVTLDVGHDTENAAHEHELRVRDASERLTQAGAGVDVVRPMSELLGETVGGPAPVTRTVVATAGGVRFDEVSRQRIEQPVVSWEPLPDLLGWVRMAERNTRFALALVDHEGGDISVYNSDVPEPETETTAGGETVHVHKTGMGGWAALKYEHETENVWHRNAEAVADELESLIRGGVRLVLLGGDPKSLSQVMERLEKSQAEIVQLESGSRAADGGDEARAEAIRKALLDHSVSRRLELSHLLKDRLGQNFAVATGVRDVADAFVQGQVETLVTDPDTLKQHDLPVKDHPGLSIGVPGDLPVRADLGLLAAAVHTGAEVTTLPQAVMGGAPVAALLRWDQGSRA
jgi:hypothetical protein